MNTRVESLRFRSLLHVEQDLESFQVLVGPNGSGKSSFLDVVGFIGDLLRVGPLRAIRGDERAGVPPRTSDPANLIWMRQGEEFELAVDIDDSRKFYLDVSPTGRASATDMNHDPGISSSGRETKVTIKGTQVLVPVVLGYGGKEVQVSLLLDTGASITTLNRDAIKKLQAPPAHKGKMILPGGNTIDADVVKLSFIKVGPHKKPNLHAAVIEHSGPAVDYQGLLGMNFLKEVEYQLDLKKQVIRWR